MIAAFLYGLLMGWLLYRNWPTAHNRQMLQWYDEEYQSDDDFSEEWQAEHRWPFSDDVDAVGEWVSLEMVDSLQSSWT